LVINGLRLSAGDLVLVKDQTVLEQNGIYTVVDTGDAATTWRIARTAQFDRSARMIAGSSTLVREGSRAGSVWALNETITAVGRDPVLFSMVYQDNRDPLIG
ncbi:unnamed protein product, partial [Phaeothamnion confervicola]